MDTISSRDSNNNLLPYAGIVAGALALVLAIVALFKIGTLNKEIAEIQSVKSRMDSVESQVSQIGQSASQNKTYLDNVAKGANDAFVKVSEELTGLKDRLTKVETARPAGRAPAAAGAHADNTPVAPGTDVYVVKAGDGGTRIAAATGFSTAQLEAVNPGIQWTKLKIGQKIVLPKK